MEYPELGKRIIIVGCSGSGKSTLARKLQELTGLPLFHLDNIWWKEDRTHITRDQFDRKLYKIMETDGWIIDGDYSRTYEPRFKKCDTVIFLDYDEEECMKGIMERIGTRRPDIPWIEKEPDPELIELVRKYSSENRPKLYDLLRKYPDKKIFIFDTRSKMQEWLSGLSQERT